MTVVIPAHNRADTIARAVLSALRQEPSPPAEVIVVDDCSSDDTAERAEQAGARVIRHETNRGAGAARNTAIASATEDWIALLDSDDEWLPNHLASLWPHRDDHVLLASAAVQRDSCGMHGYIGTVSPRGKVVRSPAAVARMSFLPASGVLVRREVVLAVGGFRPLYGVEDLDLWLRVLEHGTGYASPIVSVLYHSHPGQVSDDGARMVAGHRAVLESSRGRPWFRPEIARHWEAVVAWDAARAAQRQGDLRLAARRLAGTAATPAQIAALGRVLVEGQRLRRQTSRHGNAGAPTIAIMEDDPSRRSTAAAVAPGFETTVPDGSNLLARWISLTRRPTSAVLVSDPVTYLLARTLSIQPIRLP